MTKKSHVRQERDRHEKDFKEMKKNNKCWDELQDLSRRLTQAIVDANAQLNDVYRVPGLINFIPKKAEVSVALRGLAGDLSMFTSELSSIYAQHKDRFGGFTDEADFMVSLQVFELYTNYQTKYDSTIMPTVIFLLEQAEAALARGTQHMTEPGSVIENPELAAKIADEVEKQKLQDPNVISDVVVKEPVRTSQCIDTDQSVIDELSTNQHGKEYE